MEQIDSVMVLHDLWRKVGLHPEVWINALVDLLHVREVGQEIGVDVVRLFKSLTLKV